MKKLNLLAMITILIIILFLSSCSTLSRPGYYRSSGNDTLTFRGAKGKYLSAMHPGRKRIYIRFTKDSAKANIFLVKY